MRKWNGILTILIMILFLAHGIMGSFQLYGVGSSALKHTARAAMVLVILHGLIGAKLTADTIRTARRTDVAYIRQNLLFWARRVSGFALLVFLVLHMTAFSAGNAGAYRLKWFTSGKLVTQFLMILALAVHLISNIRPTLITFGIKGLQKKTGHILFALSVLLLFMAAAMIIYYLRWNRI